MARMALSRAKLLLLLALVAFAGAQGVGGKDSNAPENPPAAAAPPAPPAPPPAPPATSPLQARGGEVVLPNKAEIIEIAKLGVEIVAVYTAISLVFRCAPRAVLCFAFTLPSHFLSKWVTARKCCALPRPSFSLPPSPFSFLTSPFSLVPSSPFPHPFLRRPLEIISRANPSGSKCKNP